MANKALTKKLEEIDMSTYDAHIYERYHQNVKHAVEQMRVILEGLEAQNNDARF